MACEKALYPLCVALQGRLVQAQLLGQGGHGFRIGIRPHQHLRCIARQNFEHGKHHHGCTQQGGNQCEQVSGKKNTHEYERVRRSEKVGPSIAANPAQNRSAKYGSADYIAERGQLHTIIGRCPPYSSPVCPRCAVVAISTKEVRYGADDH